MNKLKFPRTFHFPFSLGLGSDDKKITNEALSALAGTSGVALVKMDGENTTWYADYSMHARSLDSKSNWTQDYCRQKLNECAHLIPSNWRVCCENVYAKHSIYYPEGFLEDYVYLLAIFNEKNQRLDWSDTLVWADKLGLPVPAVLYEGVFDLKALKQVADKMDLTVQEGFVWVPHKGFAYEDYSKYTIKFVRENHVQPSAEHWLKHTVPNGVPKRLLNKKNGLKI